MSKWKTSLFGAAVAAFMAIGSAAQAFEVGIIGFQFSSETHARVANAAAEAAKGAPAAKPAEAETEAEAKPAEASPAGAPAAQPSASSTQAPAQGGTTK